MRNAPPPLSLSLEADEGAPRGRLSPFFLRHPFVRTFLSDNPHYESRYRDKAAGRLVTDVKPQLSFALRFPFTEHIGWKMKDLMKQIIWNWQLDVKEG